MQILQGARAGDLVHVRRRTWRIRAIRAYEAGQVVTPAGVGGEYGTEKQVIAPFDAIEPVDRPRRVRLVSSSEWRRACRTLLAAHTPPGGLRSAALAQIDLLPHQLEPALAIVRGLGS